MLMSGLPVGELKGATKLKHSGTSFSAEGWWHGEREAENESIAEVLSPSGQFGSVAGN